ncbi:hypothetical protein Mgra_00008379, partial [Meloidogyne graminicola]
MSLNKLFVVNYIFIENGQVKHVLKFLYILKYLIVIL